MKAAYVIDVCRTPIGRFNGALANQRPDDLLAHVIRAVLERNQGVDPSEIGDVIAGAANQAGEDNRNVARMAALLAGLPVTVPGTTVNRLCASGLQAIMDGARQIMCGDADLIIAAGSESMTRAPFVTAKSATPFQRSVETADTTLGWRFINPALAEKYYPYTMGETAENVAERWKVSRLEQDTFALSSQQKYFEALQSGKWTDEIVGVRVPAAEGTRLVESDEHPRQSTLEKLASLKPAFKKDGTVTAGNSAGINDGAAAMLIASEEAVKRYNLRPMARVAGMGVTGVDPAVMGMGPVGATGRALIRAGIGINELDLVELNEAFAAQSIACIRELKLDVDKVNVNGGAIAIGHPLGCSGVRISATLLHEMQRRSGRYGLASMCVGVGQGAALIYEKL